MTLPKCVTHFTGCACREAELHQAKAEWHEEKKRALESEAELASLRAEAAELKRQNRIFKDGVATIRAMAAADVNAKQQLTESYREVMSEKFKSEYIGFQMQNNELREQLAQSRAEGAIWRMGLNHVAVLTDVNADEAATMAKQALQTAPSELLEAAKEAIVHLEMGVFLARAGKHKASNELNENRAKGIEQALQRLRRALGSE